MMPSGSESAGSWVIGEIVCTVPELLMLKRMVFCPGFSAVSLAFTMACPSAGVNA